MTVPSWIAGRQPYYFVPPVASVLAFVREILLCLLGAVSAAVEQEVVVVVELLVAVAAVAVKAVVKIAVVKAAAAAAVSIVELEGPVIVLELVSAAPHS